MLRPIKVVITNYPEGQIEELDAINNPGGSGRRHAQVPFSRELFIEQDDFMEVPPPKYFRLKPGGEVRLEIRLHHQVRRGGEGCRRQHRRAALHRRSRQQNRRRRRRTQGQRHDPLGQRARTRIDAEVRLYDRLFTVPEPDADGDFKSSSNPHSLEIVTAKCEPSLGEAQPTSLPVRAPRLLRARSRFAAGQARLQPHDHAEDTWAKEAKKVTWRGR